MLPQILKLTLITATSLFLAGCILTGGTDSTGMTVIKPSRAQITDAAKNVVCNSFDSITFSGKKDTPETVRQIREFNAARAAYGCPK
jgi:hypothetical protein